MTQYYLRDAALEDADELAELMNQLGYPTLPADMKHRMQSILADPHYDTIVAQQNNNVIGMAGAYVAKYYEKNGCYGRLVALIVGRSCRRKGIGSALVRAVENRLKARGAFTIIVNSHHSRSVAKPFYCHLGYEITGLRFVKSFNDSNQNTA